MKKILLLILIPLFGGSCNENSFIISDPEIVVEGWIESGGFPVVILSTTVQPNQEYIDLDDLQNNVIRWATVSINCGDKSVILIGKVDKSYYPPYIYTTSEMRGQSGKEYELNVSYKDYSINAVTSIPESIEIENFNVVKCENSDSLYQLNALIKDNKDEVNYYKFFTRVKEEDKIYLSSFMGLYGDDLLDETTLIPVYGGISSFKKRHSPYFKIDDEVFVKLAHLDSSSYEFWKDYQNVTFSSSVSFFPDRENMRSNIIGGMGYWCGYGIREYKVNIRDVYNSEELK